MFASARGDDRRIGLMAECVDPRFSFLRPLWCQRKKRRYALRRSLLVAGVECAAAAVVRDPGLDLAKRCSDAVCVLRDMPSKPGDAASRHVASSTDGRWQQQQQRATAVMALDVCQADPSINLSVGRTI